MSILDALDLLKGDFDPTIAYRWSCRMEVCGSCGMVVNGQPRLACSTFVREFADVAKSPSARSTSSRLKKTWSWTLTRLSTN